MNTATNLALIQVLDFGKTEKQNIEVMQRLGELTAYEYPILLALAASVSSVLCWAVYLQKIAMKVR